MFSDAVTEPPRPRRAFAPSHPADGALFLIYITLIWIGMVLGFGREIARHIANHEPPYPAILHVHSAVFVTWLVAFTVPLLPERLRYFPIAYEARRLERDKQRLRKVIDIRPM